MKWPEIAKESDRVTLWHINNTHQWQLGNLGPDCNVCSCWCWSGLQSSGVWTAFSHYCRWQPSRLPSPITAGDDLDNGQPRDFLTVVDEFCLHVKVSPCRSLFVASQNVATSQPGHMVFECFCTWCRRTSGMKPCGNDGQGGQDSAMKISVHFIHFYPLKKPYFSPVWHASLSRWLPFKGCVQVLHLHMSQYFSDDPIWAVCTKEDLL